MDDSEGTREARAHPCLGRSAHRLILGAAAGISMTLSASAFAQDAAAVVAGENAWDKAGCFQCHGTSGEGGAGGAYPAGPSLRDTRLDRTGLAETIGCGRPGTKMPAWLDGAYTQSRCYGLPKGPAPGGLDLVPVLGAEEIEA